MSIRVLPKALQKIAENELNENSNRIQDDLNHLRGWQMKQQHLIARYDDQWFLNFLRNAKFSLERAKEKIDQYYTMRSLAPELYDRDPFSRELQEILKRGIVSVIIDESKPLLPVIMVLRWAKADPEKFSMINVLQIIVMLLDILVNENDRIIISGLYFVGDVKGLPLGYLPQCTPSFCKKFVMSLQDVSPVRLTGICVINVPTYLEAIMNISKSFLKEKMKKRFHVYSGDFKNVYQHIPLSVIPKEYGGEGRSFDDVKDEWKQKVESYSDWFLNDAQYGTDETKRPGKPKLPTDIFGVDGSFRTLNID